MVCITAEFNMLMAPIELAHLAGGERQRNKGVGQGWPGLGGFPPPHETLHALVGAAVSVALQAFE
jgi:hypothetical protein